MQQEMIFNENIEIEVIEPMTKNEADQWKIQVETTGQTLGQLLYDGYKRDAWRVLNYGSWTQCVKDLAERSGFSKTYSFRSFEAERLQQDVLTDNNKEVPIGTDIKESQLRPLSKLKTDDEKREVWKNAVKNAPNGKVTAKHIEKTVETYKEEKQQIIVSKAKDYITLAEWEAMGQEEQSRILEISIINGSTFNKTNDNIEWARWSWNPITGCLHNCNYCYARDIANRFFPQNFEPSFLPSRLTAPDNTKLPALDKYDNPVDKMGYQNVFVCSMADLFGKWVPEEWIKIVLESIENNPQWNFLFLTKFPIRMAEFNYPDNVWLGTTVDYQHAVKRAESAFIKIKASGFKGICWLSCEPMMENLQFNSLDMFDWVVMGGSSKSSQTPEFKPPFEWIANLHNQAKNSGCQTYHKTNLMPERVREYPIE